MANDDLKKKRMALLKTQIIHEEERLENVILDLALARKELFYIKVSLDKLNE
jgi:hypothetical protein